MSGRSLADFEPLGPAERRLLEGLGDGRFDRLDGGGDGGDGADDERRVVRADLLRLLILGGPGAPPVHEKGVRVGGALIRGTLDLEGCRIPRDVGLVDCVFDSAPVLRSAILDTLFLDGSRLPALMAERLETRGDALLRDVEVEGPVLLAGARIGGALVADGATLSHPTGAALDAAASDVRGAVQLRGATVRGRVTVAGARLSGDLDATGARIAATEGVALDAEGAAIRGDVLLRRAEITGEARFEGLRCEGTFDLSGARCTTPGGTACNLAVATIGRALMLRDGARIEGLLDLRGASVGAMVDDPASWPAPGELALDRCLYGGFLAAPADADTRLRWLALQSPARWGEDFWPQPYRRLAEVLDDMGHDEEASRVLFEKERLQRHARRRRAHTAPGRAALWLRDAFLRVTVGYGRRSLTVLLWLLGLWLAGAGVLAQAERAEAIRPNLPFILRAPEWLLCATPAPQEVRLPSLAATRAGLAAPGESQLDCYRRQPEADAYPAFNPLIFALDALLPAVETGQREFWSPDTRSAVGSLAKGVVYLLTISGWVLGLLAVAAFSGLVRSR